MVGRAYIPDGDEPSEWVDVRREERDRERMLRYMRRGSRLVDRRQWRGEKQHGRRSGR